LFKSFIFLSLLCSVPAFAGVQLDATSTQVGIQGSNSLTWTHTLGNGGNRMIVCGVTFGYNDTALAAPLAMSPTMTFNGVTMTSAQQAPTHANSSTSKIFSQIFYISDTTLGTPAAGAYTVTVSNFTPVTGGISAGCSSFFGVLQPGTIESPVTSYSGSALTPATLSLTGLNVGDLVIDNFGGGYGSSGTASVGSGQTQLYNVQQAAGAKTTAAANGGEISAGSFQLATASTASISWTNNAARQAYAAVAFQAAPTTSYTVTTSVSPAGSGSIALSPTGGSYASGSSVQLTANPAIGYTFTSFSGDVMGTTNPATLVVNGNKSVTANFTASLCTLTTNVVGTGSITLSPTATNNAYTCGTQVQVTAVAGSGYSFGNFSGALSGSTNPQTITLNSSTSVTATFTQGTSCTLSTSTTGSGTITVSPAGTVFSCGTSLTITANPAQYYSLTAFSGSITGTTNPQTYVINANSSISAAFSQTSFPITTTIVGPGSVAASPVDSGSGYTPGTQVTLTATPAAGASFTGFSGAITGTTNPQTLTVNGATSVTANFLASVITQDAVSHGVSTGTAANTLSWNHTLGGGTSRAVVIAVGQTDSAASPDPSSVVTSVMFNGVYATPVPNSIINGGTSGSVQAQLFYLLESELPAAGTYTITVTLAGSVEGIQGGAVSFSNVNQAGPEAVITHRDTSGADLISTAITTLTNNAVVVDSVEDNTVATLAANTGQSVVYSASAPIGTGGSSIKFTPTAGSTTLGWAGSASRLAHSLAAFPPATSNIPATYALTTSIAGGTGGTITSNPGLSQYPVSTGVLLTANASVGYVFSSWSGDYTSTANPLPITMDTNRNVVANFAPVSTCTLAINIVGTGTVTPAAGTYNCGTVIHFVATPAAGYTFTSYSGDFNSLDNPADFTISSNATVTAEFDPIVYCSLTITSPNGSVSPGSGNFTCGTVVKLQATANSGYAFSGYSGDINTTANPATVQLNQNTNITANFTAGSSCALTTSITIGSGSITPSTGSWACGTVIAIEADPASKYQFSGWGGALAGSTVSPTTLTMSANEAVSASFAVNASGVTGDSRTVIEPSYPAVCSVLTAVQTTGSLVETSPDTVRVQAALNACAVGQAVEFSANGSANAFIIQPITLPAGVTMLVDPEITIYGSILSTDYPCTSSSFCKPLIDVAANTAPATGSAIMGDGVIDGRGGTPLTDLHKSWWGTGSDARPRLVYLSSNANTLPADNFTMYKITLKNSPKFEFSGIGNNLTIWGIKIIAPPDSPNTDGIDPSSSQNITITNSFVSDGDDMIAMKAGNGHIANVTISNNHMYSGHGITIGSETNAGLNNMLVIGDNIDNGFGGSSADSLRIKSDTSRGGEVYDVLYKNICIKNGGDTIVIDPYYSSETGSLIPNFHDITFSNVHKTVHNSSYKSTFTGYNTNGIINPLTVTFDTVYFDGDAQNDFKAPDNVNNAQFTFGPGPFSAASFFTVDAATPANYVTVTNSVTNSNGPLDCSAAFIYLAGDLTAPASTVTAGTSPKLTAVLQNVVSPLVAGTISYPQQNTPTGSVELLEGSTVVSTVTIGTGSRITYLPVTAITAGTHTYTAMYLGDGNFPAQAFGSFTLVAVNSAPTANAQTVQVPFNTATGITLTATGTGTLVYSVVANPTHGTLTGTAPSLTYTPTTGYAGADSFTFKANNGTDSNVATVTINVLSAGGSTAQTITFSAPATPVIYGASAITLSATASSSLPVIFSVTGPALLSGTTLSFTGQGTVVVTASQNGNATYAAATPVMQQIVVNPATLTVAVSGTPTRIFGQANPAFTYTIGTFVNGDTQASATTGAPSLTTTAVPKSPAGTTYPITIGIGTLAAPNYTFNLVSGQLSVTGSAVQAILFPPLANFAHGTSTPLAAIATSGLAVTFAVTSGSATITNGATLNITGLGVVTITATQPGDANFAAATQVVRTFTAQ
jgi:polygalacturonase